jgi:hypothetical protein
MKRPPWTSTTSWSLLLAPPGLHAGDEVTWITMPPASMSSVLMSPGAAYTPDMRTSFCARSSLSEVILERWAESRSSTLSTDASACARRSISDGARFSFAGRAVDGRTGLAAGGGPEAEAPECVGAASAGMPGGAVSAAAAEAGRRRATAEIGRGGALESSGRLAMAWFHSQRSRSFSAAICFWRS